MQVKRIKKATTVRNFSGLSDKREKEISTGKLRVGLNLVQITATFNAKNNFFAADLFFYGIYSNAGGVMLNQASSCIDYDP